MLVLSRKRNERIVINGNIVITVVDVRGDKVRLGIEAPTEIPVHREEVHLEIEARKQREQAKLRLGPSTSMPIVGCVQVQPGVPHPGND